MCLTLNDNDLSFNVLFHNNPTPMWIVEIDTMRFKEVNTAATKHYGYTRDEFLNITLEEIRPLEEHDDLKSLIKRIRHSQTIKKQLTHIKKNGEVMFVNITSYTVMYQNNRCRMVIINDITEQKQKDDKLKEALFRVNETLESITDGFMTLNKQFKITYYNKEAERILEIKRNEVLHKRLWAINPDYQKLAFYNYVTCSLNQKETVKFEEDIGFLNKWLCFTIYPSNEGLAIYFQDISVQKHGEEEITLKNKSLVDIAYMNSHQIRKPLANMLGIINSIEDELTIYDNLTQPFKMLKVSAIELDNIIKKINSSVEKVYK